MPRPNRTRAIGGEDALARRIAFEREDHGWSYEGLASRLAEVGCPIAASAIFKIEKGEPRRRIVVDELVAFARVFDVSIENLMLSPEARHHEALTRLMRSKDAVERRLLELTAPLVQDRDRAVDRLTSYLTESADGWPVAVALLWEAAERVEPDRARAALHVRAGVLQISTDDNIHEAMALVEAVD